MHPQQSIQHKLTTGIRRRPWRFVQELFVTFSVLWTLTEGIDALAPGIQIQGPLALSIFIVAVVVIGVYRAIPKTDITIQLKNTNTRVHVYFGNLWDEKVQRVIPVNEYFDSQLGDHVAPRSLHGQFITNTLGGFPDTFDVRVAESLSSTPFDSVSRPSGKTSRYPIGTTAVVDVNQQRHYLVALCTTNIETLKARATVPQLWAALEGLWQKVRTASGGTPVALPFIGAGSAGIGLPSQQHLQLLLISILHETKRDPIAPEIRIVLPHDCFDSIDLQSVQSEWS